MSTQVKFTVFGRPEPQGSLKSFVHWDKERKRYVSKSTGDNLKLGTWRQQVTRTALEVTGGPHQPENLPFPPDTAVFLRCVFYLEKPGSAPKRRTVPCVKPDLDKLLRAVKDALKGCAYHDDGQVVAAIPVKLYGVPERVEVTVERVETITPADLDRKQSETMELFAR